ncbi:hypothetical protein DI270_019010 [Microbispora triticiradicis]|uniref:Type II toxin-antitoxin system RelE/ParE family toxin n=3 Tax=Microbispora TaxID=2005 RepID=A0ABY3LPP4_9ACTN|nr:MULTISPECIES: hypothetical protein [Microbispora]RGA03450.1 hypothetical protein DI270_019010 [Microbispora triticiradicis]TLP51268.1 hypothetical protein FED44_34565 [Microbispora fusca]TYB47162.1 hypothetical protein FXF59_30605 [Microbispora tritici]
MYKVDLDPGARQQVEALPTEAINPFLELRALLETHPWSGQRLNPDNPKANMLTHAFGRCGLAVYLVLDEQREVHILRIDWLG